MFLIKMEYIGKNIFKFESETIIYINDVCINHHKKVLLAVIDWAVIYKLLSIIILVLQVVIKSLPKIYHS